MMIKVDLYSIAYDCPKMDRDKNCPLSKIKHLSFKERIDCIDKLDDERLEAILTHHLSCTKS